MIIKTEKDTHTENLEKEKKAHQSCWPKAVLQTQKQGAEKIILHMEGFFQVCTCCENLHLIVPHMYSQND